METEHVRRRPAAWLALSVAIALGAAACSGREGGSTANTAGAATTIADESVAPGSLDYPAYSDPNTPIYVALGRRFALKLQSDPGAGYSWQLAEPLNSAIVIALGTQLRSDDPGVPGATAQQYMSFAASGVGSTRIVVHYVSPDGQVATDPAPMTFNVTVTFTGEPPPPLPEAGTTLPAR
jgi:predicted secreted protein